MSLLDVSIVSVALPSMQQSLATTPADIQWVISGYALTFGLALVPAGRLGDAIGRRTMFLAALTLFVVCSAAAGAAPNPTLLIIARLVQGLAAGALAPQNSGLIQQLFSGAERGRAFGFFGATVGVSTAVGPLAGGLILALAGGPDGWRWIFFVNVPVGVLALVLAYRLLPRGRAGKPEHPKIDSDLTGVALLGGAVFAVLLPLVLAEADGLAQLWWLFPVAAVLAAVFVRWERRVIDGGRTPLLNIRLLTDIPGYASGIALGSVFFVGFSGIWLVFAVYFQTGLGYTPLQSGLAVTPFALGGAASAVVGGRLVDRWGRRLTVLGLGMVAAGLAAAAIVLWLVPPPIAGIAIALPMLVGGIGSGWVIFPNTTMTLRCVPVAMAGSAGGALQTGQRIGAAIGGAGLAGLFYLVLGASGGSFPDAVAVTIGVAAVLVTAALAIGVFEWRADRRLAHAEEPAFAGE